MKTRVYKKRKEWLLPTGLIVLSLVPVAAGSVRIFELTGTATVMPENARFFAAPIPVILHIISASLYCIMGAFQFVPQILQRKTGWHRKAGRLLAVNGLIAALSGLWMTMFYPWPQGDGELLYIFRLVFGLAMAISIILAVLAIWNGDIAQHRAWMVRAYAIGMGAGTQVFTHLPWFLIFGTPKGFPRAMLMGAGWLINVIVAEWIIRKQAALQFISSPAV